MDTIPSIQQAGDVHSEDRELIEKLAKLQDIHEQINELRGLLPERLLRPTRAALENPRSVSPEKLAGDLRKAASDGSRDIQRFKKDFHSPDMRELFQKTASSDFPQGRDAWAINYQGLANRFAPVNSTSAVPIKVQSTSENTASEDEEAIIKPYDSLQSSLRIERASTSSFYPLTVRVGAMCFQIEQVDNNDQKTLKVNTKGDSRSSDLETEVKEIIENANVSSSLVELLNLLETYHNFKFKACEKCQNIFDESMEYPLARRRKDPADEKTKKFDWAVLHRNCAT